MHKTPRDGPTTGSRPVAQQARFDAWRTEERSNPVTAALPTQPEYPGHFQVRLVSKSSMFRLHHRPIFSEALVDEHLGLEETGAGLWSIYL